jgi:hypothetical protein
MSESEPDEDAISEGELLRLSREEAHRVVDNQVQTLGDIDDKAARILRINLVLLSILITGFSIASNPEVANSTTIDLETLVNRYSLAGFVLLLLSTATAIITYTASNMRVGLRGSDLQSILDDDYTPQQNLEGIVESYAGWIQDNFETNAKNAPLGTLTLLFLLYSMVSFALGLKAGLTGRVELILLVGILLALAVVTYFTGFLSQAKRYWKLRNNG